MRKNVMRSTAAAIGISVAGAASSATAQQVTVTHPNGVQRTVNCQQAFYRFANDPKENLWMTCNGFEAVDVPVGGDKADPNNRDAICSITDQYNSATPLDNSDPLATQAKRDFSVAVRDAVVHGSTKHGNSVLIGINMSARIGVDPFTRYPRIIAPIQPGQQADGTFKLDGQDVGYQFINGWTRDAASWSPYRDATQMCLEAGR